MADFTASLIRLNAIAAKANISSTLQQFYNPLLGEDQQIEHLDLSSSPMGQLANSAFVGLELFTSLKTLKLNGQTTAQWAANISNLVNLEWLYIGAETTTGRANVVGDIGKLTKLKRFELAGAAVKGLYGDMRGITTLNFAFIGVSEGQDIQVTTNTRTTPTLLIYPIPGLNKSLTSFTATNYKYNSGWTTAQIGTISDLTKLTTFNISSGTATAAVINYILAQLLVLKQTPGNALTTVNISGASMAAPTGQGITDKTTLTGLGVTVTTS